MDYDEILDELGQFSKWHCLHYCLLLLFPMTGAFATLSFSFTGLEPDRFRCLIPECNENPENATVLEFGQDIFWRDENGDTDYCKRYPFYDNSTISGMCSSSDFNNFNSTEDELKECNPGKETVIYDNFGMDSTAATKFNLVCDNQYKVALAGSIYMFALLVGSYIFGTLSDLIGRRKASTIAVLVNSSGLLATAFMPDYISFTIARFITGIGGIGVFVVPFNLCVELVGNKYKTPIGLIFHAPYSIGQAILGLIAMWIRDYQTYQIVISIPGFLLLGLYFIIPESPRWLIAKKKYSEAAKVIKCAQTYNKVEVSPHLLEIPKDQLPYREKNEENLQESDVSPSSQTKDNKAEFGLLELFRHPECRKDTLVMFFAWIATNLAYFGLSLSAADLSDNVYLAVILLGLVELPSLVVIWFMDHWGRKPSLIVSFLLCGICCIAAGYCSGTTKLVLALLGKCGSAGCFEIIYNYTVEMYPTVVRTTGLGLCSMAGRFGGILAPLVALYLPSLTFDELPLIIFGGTTFVAALLSLILPETLGAPLIESLDELLIVRKHAKPLLTWWSNTQVNNNVEKIVSLRHKS